MKVQKALITAAGLGARLYPATLAIQKEMFPLLDRDGIVKPTIQIIIEEAISAGIEEIAIITNPRNQHLFYDHFRNHDLSQKNFQTDRDWAHIEAEKLNSLEKAIEYIVQKKPDGMGHAIYCAKDWVDNENFLLLTGDLIYISDTPVSCMKQSINAFTSSSKSVISLLSLPDNLISLYGVAQVSYSSDQTSMYRVVSCKEKPTIEYAEQHLKPPNGKRNYYLCLSGMYVLTPEIFECLNFLIENDVRNHEEIEFTSALNLLCNKGLVEGFEIKGQLHDIGNPFGLIETQLSLGLSGVYQADLLKLLKKYKASQRNH